MAIVVIPVNPGLLNYEFRIDLDGVTYTLGIRFNSREDRWFLDVKDASETPIILGIKVILNVDLIGRFQQAELPSGELFVLNSDSDEEVEPGAGDLGENTLLLYNEAGS